MFRKSRTIHTKCKVDGINVLLNKFSVSHWNNCVSCWCSQLSFEPPNDICMTCAATVIAAFNETNDCSLLHVIESSKQKKNLVPNLNNIFVC